MQKNLYMIRGTCLIMASLVFLMACASPSVPPAAISTLTPMPSLTAVLADTPTVLLSPTSLPTPTETPTVQPTRKPEASLFSVLSKSLLKEAQKRREKRALNDPNYYKRVDKKLNAERINVLLFGYGETHEPPVTEKAIIGSHTIISYDLRTQTADVISITHDTRSPEVERKLGIAGARHSVRRIDQAYFVGGFDLMGQTLENATGLTMDFQISFHDAVIQGFVDNVFGGVEVNVPMAFEVHPFYLNGKKYPVTRFPQGRQKLSGTQVIQFIKTVPVAEVAYDVSLEHNLRKYIIFESLLESMKAKSTDPRFWLNMGRFANGEISSGAIAYDFDQNAIVKDQIGPLVVDLGMYVAKDKPQSGGLGISSIDETLYIVDQAQGDGGVRWVNPNVDDPYMRADIAAKVYPGFDMEVPYYGNPYAEDLANEYWGSVRNLVKTSLVDCAVEECQPFQTRTPTATPVK
jgi:hypothetical protein